MSYLQPEGTGNRRVYSIVAVGLIHLLFAYALISGLAIKAVQVITGPLETVNIEDTAPPPEDIAPPPPKLEDIPPYVPPPDVQVMSDAPPPPTITTQTTIPVPQPTVAPPAPPAPPPPAPKGPTKAAQPNMRTLATSQDDYPGASLRAEEEGVTRVEVIVDTRGRVSACEVIQSSGHSRLDEATCRIAQRRWRFSAAERDGEKIDSRFQQNVRWQILDR